MQYINTGLQCINIICNIKKNIIKRKKNEIKQKQICAEEGHIGEWAEDTYYEDVIIDRQKVSHPFTRWIRTCTRCGEKEISTKEP